VPSHAASASAAAAAAPAMTAARIEPRTARAYAVRVQAAAKNASVP
jgi:hypothetical protein